ncbi:carboxy-cis,cis-muconate cyclase [Pseudohyphozyma bogoriensis]|nr:carboxy-cis,cis-muconate cyclase [Pseudohyphozyma bogoriensis]
MTSGPFLLYSAGYEGRVCTLEFDPTASPPTLKIISENTEVGPFPTWLVLSPDGKWLYVSDEAEEGLVTALPVLENGKLGSPPTPSYVVRGAAHLGYAAKSNPPVLITASYVGQSVSVRPILPSGDIDTTKEQVIDYANLTKPGPHAWRQSQSHPHEAHIDPTGKYVVIPDLGTDELHFLQIGSDGQLSKLDSVLLSPADGPRHVFFSRNRSDGNTLFYCLNELSNTVSIFSVIYSPHPTLTLLQTVSTLPPKPHSYQDSFERWHAAEIKVSPDNQFLYASNRADDHQPGKNDRDGPEDTIACWELGPDGTTVGEAKLLGAGGRAPRHFSFSSERSGAPEGDEGKWMAVANHDTDEVVMFERNGKVLKEVVRAKGVGLPGMVLWA